MTVPEVARIVVVPTAIPVASPEALIDATPGVVELQLTELVKSRDEPSLNVPVAVNCCVPAIGIEEVVGLRAMEARLMTVKVVVPVIGPELACIVVVPAAIAVANPEELIEATIVFEELQPTEPVRS
jgi:hypothetical protein